MEQQVQFMQQNRQETEFQAQQKNNINSGIPMDTGNMGNQQSTEQQMAFLLQQNQTQASNQMMNTNLQQHQPQNQLINSNMQQSLQQCNQVRKMVLFVIYLQHKCISRFRNYFSDYFLNPYFEETLINSYEKTRGRDLF